MTVIDNISLKINRLPKGYVFTYRDVISDVSEKEAVIKALNRLVASGKIEKLSKGRFYKSEITPFGKIEPKQYQIVKDLLEKDGYVIGYLTGYSIYNQLGLTTQISNIIQIGKNEIRPLFKRGIYTISFIKQKNIITKKNIPLLQILDSIRFIKKIPDTSMETSCKRFLDIISNLVEKDKLRLARLSLKYPPATRALLGALLESIDCINIAEPLKKSLNPITKYQLHGIEKVLPNALSWGIKL